MKKHFIEEVKDASSIVTHRVVTNKKLSGEFRYKKEMQIKQKI